MSQMIRIALIIPLLGAPAALARLTYKDDVLVYANRQPQRQNQLAAVFDAALTGNKPVVLFIHGRGDEPEKSINGEGGLRELFRVAEGHAVRKIENYGVTVILFSWDSIHGDGVEDRDLPLSKTPHAAERLKTVLDACAAALDRHPDHQPVTLLAHSMGNIVLQRYLEAHDWPRRLFGTVVLSSSDADNKGHAAWVDEIGSVERVFISVNDADFVLNRATDGRDPNVLPMGKNPGAARSTHATYFEIRSANHEIFAKSRRDPIFKFFDAVFDGAANPPIPSPPR